MGFIKEHEAGKRSTKDRMRLKLKEAARRVEQLGFPW